MSQERRQRWPDAIHARYLELRRKAEHRRLGNRSVRKIARKQIQEERESKTA